MRGPRRSHEVGSRRAALRQPAGGALPRSRDHARSVVTTPTGPCAPAIELRLPARAAHPAPARPARGPVHRPGTRHPGLTGPGGRVAQLIATGPGAGHRLLVGTPAGTTTRCGGDVGGRAATALARPAGRTAGRPARGIGVQEEVRQSQARVGSWMTTLTRRMLNKVPAATILLLGDQGALPRPWARPQGGQPEREALRSASRRRPTW